MSIVFESNLAIGTLPVVKFRLSRPPLGATQKAVPPCLSIPNISDMAFKFCRCFRGFVSGSVSICYLEWMQMRLRPMLNGMANASVVTLCPATYVIPEAASGKPACSKQTDMTWGSASDWWLAKKTTLSPAANWSMACCKWWRPWTTQLLMTGRKKSHPNWFFYILRLACTEKVLLGTPAVEGWWLRWSIAIDWTSRVLTKNCLGRSY